MTTNERRDEAVTQRAPGKKKGRPTASKKQRATAARAVARRRQLRNRLVIGGGGTVVAVIVVWLLVGGVRTGVTDPAAWDLPAMGPTAERQERVTLAEFRGSPTIANFFASWCVECDRELPGFERVSAELGDRIDFVGIASQETGDPLHMPTKHGVDWWPLAHDLGGSHGGLSRELGARGMPLTAFYDAEGRLLHTQLGSMSEAQLRSAIEQLYGIAS